MFFNCKSFHKTQSDFVFNFKAYFIFAKLSYWLNKSQFTTLKDSLNTFYGWSRNSRVGVDVPAWWSWWRSSHSLRKFLTNARSWHCCCCNKFIVDFIQVVFIFWGKRVEIRVGWRRWLLWESLRLLHHRAELLNRLV